MKIGIMSMQRIPNYGSFMQALGLKRMIESLGHEVVFVDYTIAPSVEKRDSKTEKIKCWLKVQRKAFSAKGIGRWLYRKCKGKSLANMDIMFACHNMLGITDVYLYRRKVDVLVIGSDEVFNCTQKGYTVGYSLELFGKNRRAKRVITYAASFGNTTIEKLQAFGIKQEIADLLSDFDALSVRDANSKDIIQELTGIIPEIHLDPALLAGIETYPWQETSIKDAVILYGYTNRFTEEECQAIMSFAHSKGKKVIALGEEQRLCDIHIRCRPDELLPFFANADCVITDTFHGTIFSVIHHKKFLAIPRATKQGESGNEEKLIHLLKQLHLEERIMHDLNNIQEKMDANIDYQHVERIREREYEKTIDYLRTSIC